MSMDPKIISDQGRKKPGVTAADLAKRQSWERRHPAGQPAGRQRSHRRVPGGLCVIPIL